MACTCRQRRAVSRVHNRSCRVYLDACKRKMQPRHVSSSAHETAMYDVHLPPFRAGGGNSAPRAFLTSFFEPIDT